MAARRAATHSRGILATSYCMTSIDRIRSSARQIFKYFYQFRHISMRKYIVLACAMTHFHVRNETPQTRRKAREAAYAMPTMGEESLLRRNLSKKKAKAVTAPDCVSKSDTCRHRNTRNCGITFWLTERCRIDIFSEKARASASATAWRHGGHALLLQKPIVDRAILCRVGSPA